MAYLQLIKAERSGLLLQGREPGKEFEYFDLDGEGGKAHSTPVTPWNEQIEYLGEEVEYNFDDTDSFWSARSDVLTSAKNNGVKLPKGLEY